MQLGDIIEFVEQYFNLSFKESMQKINIDFGLGLENNYIDYEKLKRVKNIQNEKKKKKKQLTNKYCELCDIKLEYEKMIYHFAKKINIKNWEMNESVISYLKTQLFHVKCEIEEIDNKLSSRT